ncbi:class I SAM-dependent methyltransferase [Actinomadura darangshiensis]|uniref:Class I SAM-dependent methyltransferase n=1 Tax=Actinomadura darangshiensis TaxID=705336 RepID=A0A4R5B811_9ACTN|nr:class I SAM-dependent methyltransferase [Actinomadura darangshiensis]TDD81099.1 class I SAM-dependent methyltransferase [Actinomadura darangshiensis]
MSDDDYLFDTASELGLHHMNFLENLFDPITADRLDAVGVRAGARCLDIGAGGGSVTRRLAGMAGPAGKVVSIDLDIDHLTAAPGVTVLRHDITEGVPPGGPFDLIHARLVLVHLPARERVLTMLVDALAPGGSLVLGELTDRPPRVLSAPSPADAELFKRIQYLSMEIVGPAAGQSFLWGTEVAHRMADAGLVDVQGVEYCRITRGGDDGCLLHRNLNVQAEPALLAAGATAEELERYRELMLDPRFTAWFYQFVCLSARKPI